MSAPNEEDTIRRLDQFIFKNGYCLFLALELLDAFKAAGIGAEFCYLRKPDHLGGAAHVMVRTHDGFWDADFGPHTEAHLMAEYGVREKAIILPNAEPFCTDSGLLLEMRRRASFFIARNRPKFGLPCLP